MRRLSFLLLFLAVSGRAETFQATAPLTTEGDLAARMVEGIDKYLTRENEASITNREHFWKRDFSSNEAYVRSVEANRKHFRDIIGVVDERTNSVLESKSATPASSLVNAERNPSLVGEGHGFRIYSVQWNVFRGVHAEGLLLIPTVTPILNVIALPDCDWTPESIAGLDEGTIPVTAQFARRLAENGCEVLIPVLIDRSDSWSGLPGVRHARQCQREFLWRASYEMGRTLVGYEVQKVLAAVDWFKAGTPGRSVAVIGYGEGGLIALYAGAVDTRITAAAVSGYFQPREALASEPIYRNVWSLLEQFGDAEVASLIAPRSLIVENGSYPETEYPGPGKQHDGAAPGKLTRPPAASVEREIDRARKLVEKLTPAPRFELIQSDGTGSPAVLKSLLKGFLPEVNWQTNSFTVKRIGSGVESHARQGRQYEEILQDTQYLMRESEYTRAKFWSKAPPDNGTNFQAHAQWYKDYFWDEIIGRLPTASLAPNPRSRLISETDHFRGYEVMLDVYPDVFAYGILLVPKDIRPGEKRAVVVCQHGLEGRPSDVADPKIDNPAYHTYACRLAEQGYITFAPQNPYIGHNNFRQVLRKGQPLKKTLFSFIVRQHEVILNWLAGLDIVDPTRMAFYGLSYGGKTAVRVPPLLDRYCLAICSADYNEWIWKNVSARSQYSYLYGGEYDMPEFNLGNTFNYAELSWMIFPRPFMVERGHEDGVSSDEWVSYEFAKTRKLFDKLGAADKTSIEIFSGPHTIHGVGTFEFLRTHLSPPATH